MKSIKEYIFEEENTSKVKPWIDVSVGMFRNASDISKDTVSEMLYYLCESGRIKKLSDYFFSENQSDYLAYQPPDDEFLDRNNDKKICSQMAEYIIKFIVKKN